MLFTSLLAETNRAPFYLSERTSELESGHNAQYLSIKFPLFF